MQALWDTNVISELVRPTPNPNVVAWGQQFSIIFISVITLEEITYGLSAKPNARIQSSVNLLLANYCTIFPVTAEIARIAGQMRGQFKSQGVSRTQADMLIAATAKHHDFVLATRNTRDFQGCGLQLTDPFE